MKVPGPRGPLVVPVAAAAALTVLLTGCGTQTQGTVVETRVENLTPAGPTANLPSRVPAAPGEVRTRTSATVLDIGEGPALCLGPVAESFPPQCTGPALLGWEWDEQPHEEESGTRWTTASVRGTFDGESFTLVEVLSESEELPAGAVDLETPCPAPSGGWAVLDPATTTAETLEEARSVASRTDGTTTWLDPTGGGAVDGSEVVDALSETPTWVVLNVATAGDVEEVEREIRQTWGGKLCVTNALRPDAALERALRQVPGLITTYAARNGTVVVEVLHDDGSLREWAERTYGADVVEVVSALVPVD